MYLYTVDTDYIDYLSKFQDHIWINDENQRLRPYVGIVLDIGGYKYFAPLSSPKAKHLHMAERLDFIKLEYRGQLKAVINLNNIIPVPDTLITKIDIDNLQDKNYKDLLNIEMIAIRKKQSIITKNAQSVYSKVTKYGTEDKNSKLVTLCYDFHLLEQKSNEYIDHV